VSSHSLALRPGICRINCSRPTRSANLYGSCHFQSDLTPQDRRQSPEKDKTGSGLTSSPRKAGERFSPAGWQKIAVGKHRAATGTHPTQATHPGGVTENSARTVVPKIPLPRLAHRDTIAPPAEAIRAPAVGSNCVIRRKSRMSPFCVSVPLLRFPGQRKVLR